MRTRLHLWKAQITNYQWAWLSSVTANQSGSDLIWSSAVQISLAKFEHYSALVCSHVDFYHCYIKICLKRMRNKDCGRQHLPKFWRILRSPRDINQLQIILVKFKKKGSSDAQITPKLAIFICTSVFPLNILSNKL